MTTKVIFRDCDSCGSSHMGSDCGMTFAQRLRTTKVDWAKFDTKDLKNYYDSAAVAKQFGHDATDRLYDESDGLGWAQQDNKGEWWHKSRNKEPEKMTEKQMETLTGLKDEE